MAIRGSQDVTLVVDTPSTTKIRDSQDLSLVVATPSTAKIRDSQDLSLVVIQRTWFGTEASTLRHLTSDSTGTVTGNFTGTEASTLTRLGCTASGTVGAAGSFTGTEASTLRHVTASGAGKLNEYGTVAATLRHVTVAATGTADSEGAVTLPRLSCSGSGVLKYSGTAAATLHRLTPAATGTAFYRFGTAAATLRHLSAAATGTALGKAYLTHDVFWKYKADDLKVAWVQRYRGSRQVQVSRRVPAGALNQVFDAVFTESSVVALTLYSSQDVSVQVNAQTFSLTKQQPLIWTSDSLEDYPFDADVSTILVSNPSTLAARFTVSVLILDERIG